MLNKNIDLNKNIVFQKPGGNEKIDGMQLPVDINSRKDREGNWGVVLLCASRRA